MTKRNLFAEISEGFNALAGKGAGKKTLRTHEVDLLSVTEVIANTYLKPALAAGAIEMTLPDKPSSGLQKYRKTGPQP